MNIPPRSLSSVANNISYLFCISLVGILFVSISQSDVVEAFLVVPTTGINVNMGVMGTSNGNGNDFLNNQRSSSVSSIISSRSSSSEIRNQGCAICRMLTTPLGSISISSPYSNSGTRLYAVPQKRIARRDMKKRPNRRGRRSGNSISTATATTSSSSSQSAQKTSNNFFQNNNSQIVESELRPLVRAKKVEAGEDYWIDEDELQKSLDRKIALKNRKANEGEISKDKLRTEVVAPYKQNWIGLFSVGVIVLAMIVTNFPELLNSPVIQIPDL